MVSCDSITLGLAYHDGRIYYADAQAWPARHDPVVRFGRFIRRIYYADAQAWPDDLVASAARWLSCRIYYADAQAWPEVLQGTP